MVSADATSVRGADTSDGVRPLLITPGDPQGIGPEVTAHALSVMKPTHPVVVVGDADVCSQALRAFDLEPAFVTDLTPIAEGIALLDPGELREPVEVSAIRFAAEACLDGRAAGIVTGPINKAKLAERGFAYRGHTDFLAHLCGDVRPVMAFVGGECMVCLVTVHLPLREVSDAITAEGILHTLRTANDALRRVLGLSDPKLLVCGLNPHAGDGGLLGWEEEAIIAPAIRLANDEGILAQGPVSAEAAFWQAGKHDMVVAMYHDQGLAPLKRVDFGHSVNWTLGLPILRTSVDHGTAYDIVGTQTADPASMIAALTWAERLSLTRRTSCSRS